MEKYYTTSKLLVFPSLYEGLPNTLIDALNYSLPCISTKCSGAEDILSKDYIISKKIGLNYIFYKNEKK